MWPWIWQLVAPVDAVGFWTMVMTIATVALLVVARRGLDSLTLANNSLTLAKADMLSRSQRESRACAIARCEEMANDIIAKNSELITKFAALKLPLFVQSAGAVRFDSQTSDDVAKAQEWLQQVPADLHRDCVGVLNRIEAWSMYFTNGVADHEIAYGPCAPVFCTMIFRYYPFLLVRRAGHSTSGKFPNAVTLFQSWRGKIEAEQDGIKMQELLQSMKDLEKKRENQPTLPPPIGTGN